jgi:mono/diheme cytochrome c family protein
MKSILRMFAAMGLLLLVPLTASGAKPSFGQREFATRCQMCHGPAGRGDGWLADQLIRRPPTISLLARKNGGVFPREQVARIIDGRSPIKLHGPTEMPAWGNIYRAEIDAAAGTRRGVREEDEVNVSYRIQALIEYLASIQEQ